MNWQEEYKEKIVTAAEAVKAIKNEDYLVCSHAAASPQVILREMVAQKDRFRNVHIYHMVPLGYGDYLLPENAEHFHHISNFAGNASRQAMAEGKADFLPAFFKDIPGLIGEIFPIDVAVVNLSPPDKEGYCSIGLACDYTQAGIHKAKIVIAQINEYMPYVGSTNKIHLSQLDYIVLCSDPIPEIPRPVITDVEREIGRNCASLINDGDTLQLGIGAIPDAVLLFLKDKKDLGIHTEMFSDGAMELIRAGVINGKRKTLHPNKLVATFLMGTRELYDFLNYNTDVEMFPVDYVNDPAVIGQNDNLVSVNSCIEIDLMGQVNSESIGLKQFSGTGGQVDYVRGASISKGGRSIMAMPSTASKGKISRIVPFLSEGGAVTTSRNDVDYVVTEYGMAKLKGRTLRQRAQALIDIAHPNFREGLMEEYNKRFNTKNI